MDLLKSRSFWCSLLLHGLAVAGIWGSTFLVTSGEESTFRPMIQEAVADAAPMEPAPPEEPEAVADAEPPDPDAPEPEPVLLEEPEPPTPDWEPLEARPRPIPHLLVRPREPEPAPPPVAQEQEPPPEPEVLPPVEEVVEDARAWLLEGPSPDYPRRASARRLQGLVVLLVTVDEAGLVSTVTVETSSGHAILDQAAERAVRKWRFRIKEVQGRPTSYQARARVQFVHPDA